MGTASTGVALIGEVTAIVISSLVGVGTQGAAVSDTGTTARRSARKARKLEDLAVEASGGCVGGGAAMWLAEPRLGLGLSGVRGEAVASSAPVAALFTRTVTFDGVAIASVALIAAAAGGAEGFVLCGCAPPVRAHRPRRQSSRDEAPFMTSSSFFASTTPADVGAQLTVSSRVESGSSSMAIGYMRRASRDSMPFTSTRWARDASLRTMRVRISDARGTTSPK